MAVLSPALVVAMCVMFVLTRLHKLYYIFEHPFLFGLKYCLEPDREQLAALAQATSAAKNPQPAQGRKKAKQPAKASGSSSKPKISVTSLALRRAALNETFFSSDAEFPHHREMDHLMAICCGYIAAYLFEDVTSCLFPDLLTNRRSAYVGLFGVAFAVVEAWRISVGLTSTRVMLVLLGIAWLVAMFFLSSGDFITFIKFDQAFGGLRKGIATTLASRFQMDETVADGYGRNMSVFSRFLIATAAAFISACMAAPARRFSRIDYDLNLQYRQDEASHQDDPYSLGRPSPLTMLRVALDYVVPFLTVFLWGISPRGGDSYGSWRIAALLACVVVRLGAMRVRLQAYLDGGIDAYRKFWTEKSATSVTEAGRATSLQVIGTSFYLILIAMAYLAPAVIPLLLALMTKLDGGIASGLCPINGNNTPTPFQLFAREVPAFLAWWSIASYSLYATISILVEVIIDYLDPGARDKGGKLPMPTSASEKRKQKRVMQERLMKSRMEPREAKT